MKRSKKLLMMFKAVYLSSNEYMWVNLFMNKVLWEYMMTHPHELLVLRDNNLYVSKERITFNIFFF